MILNNEFMEHHVLMVQKVIAMSLDELCFAETNFRNRRWKFDASD